MFPELSALLKIISADEFVIDGEAIGYDPQTGSLRSFQQTITRKRKHNVAEATEKVPLKFFIFDVLLLNQRSLLSVPLRERKEILSNLFIDTEQIIKTSFILTKTHEELQKYHEEQLALGLEGMVVKAVDSPYQSGRKGWYGVKMKEE
jgi:DNA ligase-1